MNFPLYIAKRYVRSKSTQNAVNIINFITFLVIVIGSAALFIVLSGFAGLKTFSLSFTNSFDPELKALPVAGKFFSISPEQEGRLNNIEGLAFYSKEIEEKVYLEHRGKNHIAYIKGIDSNYIKVINTDTILYLGDWTINDQQVVSGVGIANILSVTINQYRSPMQIYAFKPGKGSISQQGVSSLYNKLPVIIGGVYAVEADLDNKYVFADLTLTQALLEKTENDISGINFKLDNEVDEQGVRSEIMDALGEGIVLKNRQELNSTLYKMLNTENMATYLIFTLVLIIALFNVVGAIIMMILDKQQNSKTLYSLGTTIRELRNIYFVQGILVTGFGGFIGVLLGSILVWSQIAFGWLRITPSLAYPVEFKLFNVLIVLATILVLGVIASKIASSRINKKLIAA
ncbi:FtsX-like permease family protein [Maribacter sp. PR1]|uniref:FtsX-like permease family protein n=1 Tax=Maribacter cobaltidurans TaxID=1178778 RepID=A0ABU7IQW1_9FLAO|nr:MULTISPECIES: FtsX-like permease family protein [Maribacter]MDC6387881.1 FtsX-like permease family protein [Maribacter sp. PR1]MEE1975270.1 FtsX-like permease family protein [Maribacter cobaltidurans]